VFAFFLKNQQALYQRTTTIDTRDGRMYDHCPGAANLRTPTLKVKKCPQCGGEVEVFSNDVAVKCTQCGFVVYNDIASCVQWCKHAQECVGIEMFERLTHQKKQ
jgi:ribosomal protein S27E